MALDQPKPVFTPAPTGAPEKRHLARPGNSPESAEKEGQTIGDPIALRDAANNRGSQGFQQVFRLPMSEQTPLASQIANQNSRADDVANGLRRRIAMSVAPGAAGPADALQNNDANRAVKLLFVLHQTPAGQGSAAPALKARQP
jgi:hypothetical protein